MSSVSQQVAIRGGGRSTAAAMRRAVLDALRRWSLTPAGGEQIRRLEEIFSEYLSGRHTLAVSSATTAIEIILRAVPVGPGDEVVLPAYDWGAAAGAVLRCGAQPVFADIDPVTATLDAGSLEAHIGKRSVAVVVTHLAGCPANLDAILAVARRHGLFVLEDCAQALGAQHAGRPVGSQGDAAAFSFGWGKLVCAGEGGLAAFRDAALWRRAIGLSQHPLRQLREGAFLLGDMALNGRMHPLAVTLVLAQWEFWPHWLTQRRRACLTLSRILARVPSIVAPQDPPYGQHSFHRYVIGVPNESVVDRLAEDLTKDGLPVACGPLREPLHLRPIFNGRFRKGDFPEAERRCRTSLFIETDWSQTSKSWTSKLASVFRAGMLRAQASRYEHQRR